jgi:hypothetical protein
MKLLSLYILNKTAGKTSTHSHKYKLFAITMWFIYSTNKVKEFIFSYIGRCKPVLLYELKICDSSCSDAHWNIARKTYSVRYGYVRAFLTFTPSSASGRSHSQVRILLNLKAIMLVVWPWSRSGRFQERKLLCPCRQWILITQFFATRLLATLKWY